MQRDNLATNNIAALAVEEQQEANRLAEKKLEQDLLSLLALQDNVKSNKMYAIATIIIAIATMITAVASILVALK